MGESRWAAMSSDAIDDRELTLTDLRVLGCIGYHSDRRLGAWPKQQTIADRLGVSREAVNRSIKHLTDKGYIKALAQFRKSGGKRESRYFVILDPDLEKLPLAGEDEVETPLAPGDVTARSHRDVTCTVTPPVIAEITSTKEEHTNKNTPPTPDGVGGVNGKGSEFSEEGFTALWAAWPIRGQQRSAGTRLCREAYAAACKGHTPSELLAAARAFVAVNNASYTPGLQKWLATRQYEHFINRPNSATPSAAPTQAGVLAPTEGREGACYRALVERFGEVKVTAWLRGAEWRDHELVLPFDYARQRVDVDMGGILRVFDFEAVTRSAAA
jgi:Helix-turn-helix domain